MANEKASRNMDKSPQWRTRVQELFQVCQDELKRTTEIGKKMLTASKTNSSLHEAYEDLGILAAKALRDGSLEWDNPRVKELLNTITNCEHDLEAIEDEVNKIKFAAGTVDVSSAKSENTSGQKKDSSSTKKTTKPKENKKKKSDQ